MTRLVLLMVAVVGFGCSKPTEPDCRKAITNMQRLMGTENLKDADGIESEVRRCKGGSTKKAVSCAIAAQTLEDLRKCEFFKVPEGAKGIGTKDEGSAGSAAPGSAAPGSAAPGSAAPGSAEGSAAAGSAAAGSAAGSAAVGSAGATPVGSAAGSAAVGSAVGSAK